MASESAIEEDQTNAVKRRAAGEFVRGVSTARHVISPAKDAQYPPAAGRYHLYIAFNCPWCHRVALTRAILGLEDAVTMDVAFPNRTDQDDPKGPNLWIFRPSGRHGSVHVDGCTADTVGGERYAVDIYRRAGVPKQRSLPILYDKKTRTVVNNESAEIIRMFAQHMAKFSRFARERVPDLYPAELAEKIDEMNAYVYPNINNGAYKAGFSSDQKVYEKAYDNYFSALDRLDALLAHQKYLCGDTLTEADVRLFPTIFRHDPVYYARMKLNKAKICHFPNLWRWISDIYNMEGVARASPLAHSKQGYVADLLFCRFIIFGFSCFERRFAPQLLWSDRKSNCSKGEPIR